MRNKGVGPGLAWETKVGYPRLRVAGVDEVGRGCLAGPVVAAAVVLPAVCDLDAEPWLKEVADSKLLSPQKREELAPRIESWALASAVGVASVEEIDEINIFHASHLAMLRALEGLKIPPAFVLIDGKFLPKKLPCSAQAVIKGDLQCLSIACASVLAKVWRDREMRKLDARYPGYGFSLHKGYSTPVHSQALKSLGACEIHRRSFAPVAQALKAQGAASVAQSQGVQGVQGVNDPQISQLDLI